MEEGELEAIIYAFIMETEKERDDVYTLKQINGRFTTAEYGHHQYLTGQIHAYRRIKDLIDGDMEKK